MTQEEKERIFKEMEKATAIVNSWPEWKRHILQHSSSPTVTVPRKPV